MFNNLLPLLTLLIAANPDARQSLELDIYNRDQALVREVRRVDLDKGEGFIDFHHISDGIFGHTVQIRPLEEAGEVTTLQVTYNYDLVSQERMLTHYLGRWFSFASDDMAYEGRLLKFDDTHLYLQPDTTDKLVEVVDRGKLTEMFYPEIPEYMFIQPTIRWNYHSAGKHKNLPVELSYITDSVNWLADYRAELLPGDTLLLSGWFTIYNDLPLDFPAAQVSLVSGWTRRSDDPDEGDAQGSTGSILPWSRKDRRPVASPAGERIFEYYRYRLPRAVDLHRGQTVQAPFFAARQVPAQRRYVLPHLLQDERVEVRVAFDPELLTAADDTTALRGGLPEGTVGLYQRSADGSLVFVGEDELPPPQAGGMIELQVGVVSDVTARRIRLAQSRPDRSRHQETWRVEFDSGRAEPITVNVEQRVFGYYEVADAEVNGAPVQFELKDAGRISFPVAVQPGSGSALTFTLLYGY